MPGGDQDRVTKGTVIGFDQLNDHDFPGETLALKEVFGWNKIQIKKERLQFGTVLHCR